jgi:hypothetical protein
MNLVLINHIRSDYFLFGLSTPNGRQQGASQFWQHTGEEVKISSQQDGAAGCCFDCCLLL